MNIKIPKKFMGSPIKGAMQRVLDRKDDGGTPPGAGTQNQSTGDIAPFNINSPEDYIFLPGRTHGSYSYPNLEVSMYRLNAAPQVVQAANKLGFQVQDTAKEQNGRDYIGSVNWEQVLKINLSLEGLTLNNRQIIDLIELLKSGDAKDANGNNIPKPKLEEILNEITQVREPWRAEWLGAKFEDKSGKLHINHSYKLVNGVLVPDFSEKLEETYLRKNCWISYSGINNQGMPTQEGKDIYYYSPVNGSVAGFWAYSGWAGFNCSRGPAGTDASLGVRYAREARGATKN